MAGVTPNFNKRSFLLPPGCMDLIDLAKGECEPASGTAIYFRSGHKINSQITAKWVRVFDESSEMIGVMLLADALEMAESRKVDLVEVHPGEPSACVLIDYGKFQRMLAESFDRWAKLFDESH